MVLNDTKLVLNEHEWPLNNLRSIWYIQNHQKSTIPLTSFLVGTFFAVSYSKMALVGSQFHSFLFNIDRNWAHLFFIKNPNSTSKIFWVPVLDTPYPELHYFWSICVVHDQIILISKKYHQLIFFFSIMLHIYIMKFSTKDH